MARPPEGAPGGAGWGGDAMSRRDDRLTFTEILSSVLLSAFGVQTRANMERDLTRGEVLQFIAVGLLFTVGFVVSLVALVLTVAG